MIPIPSLTSNSASEARGSATSGGNLNIGGNPNLAAIGGGGNTKFWIIGAVAVVALFLLLRRKGR